jgi:hypothetical protein
MAEFFIPSSSLISKVLLLNIFFIAAIPIASLIIALLRPITRGRLRFRNKLWLTAFFVANVVSFFYFGTRAVRHFSEETAVIQDYDLEGVTADTIRISWIGNPLADSRIRIGPLVLSEDLMVAESVKLEINRAENSQLTMDRIVEARGRTPEDARQIAEEAVSLVEVDSMGVTLAPYIEIRSGEKWRNQTMRYRLHIPVGKAILIDAIPEWEEVIHHMEIAPDSPSGRVGPGEVWVMTEEGLTRAN